MGFNCVGFFFLHFRGFHGNCAFKDCTIQHMAEYSWVPTCTGNGVISAGKEVPCAKQAARPIIRMAGQGIDDVYSLNSVAVCAQYSTGAGAK